MLTWTNETRRLGDLIPWPRNPRKIDKDEARRLSESLDEFGQVDVIAIGPENQVYNGHQRLDVWAQEHGPDYEVAVRVASRELTEKEREKLVVLLHKGAAGDWNFDTLANEFELDELLEWGFKESELGLTQDKDSDAGLTPPTDLEYRIVIDCAGEAHQAELLERFEKEGLTCRALIS